MIMFFRNLSETWIAKFLLAIIAISMGGLFGLGSMTDFWGKDNTAIRVGSNEVRPQELVRDIDKKARQMSAMTGNKKYFSIQDALNMGILQQTITEKITSFLTQSIADDLGLVASSASVGNYITNNPNFQTITGTYDRSIVMAYLQQMQLSEQEFTTALQEELARKHLTDAIEAIVAVPTLLQEQIYTYANERRNMNAILIPVSSVQISEKPTEEQLKEYYDAMEDTLYAPEYRQVTILRLTPDKVAKDIPVSDDDLKALYESKQDLFVTPEQRRVDQILVKDKETADALFKELNAKNFETLAKQKANQDKKDIELGWVEKNSVMEEVGEAVFSAPTGKVLPPLETSLGYHILIVRDVKKAVETPFEKVKEDLRKSVQAEKAYDLLYEKSKILDNALGEGQTLENAAKLIGVTTEKPVFIDASGKQKDGKTTADLPSDLLQKLFLSKKDDVSPLYDYQNGYIVGQVNEIESVYLKPFDAVQDELKAEWKRDMQKKNASSFADKVLKAAQKDKTLKTISLFYHLENEELNDVRRLDIKSMPQDTVEKLFDTKVGNFSLVALGNDNYAIVQVTKVIPADEKDDFAKKMLALELKQQLANSLWNDMITFYGKKEKVEINQPLIEETFSHYVKEES